MLSSKRSLWECNDQHVASLELQQSYSWSGGQRGGEQVGVEHRVAPLVSLTSLHFVLKEDKNHSEQSTWMLKLCQA